MYHHYVCCTKSIAVIIGVSFKIRNHLTNRYLQICKNLHKFENVDKNNCIIDTDKISRKVSFDKFYYQSAYLHINSILLLGI